MISALTLIALSFTSAPAEVNATPPSEAPVATAFAQRDETKKDTKKPVDKVKGDKKRGERRRGQHKRGAAWKALKKQFDKDGDGKLNEAERQALREHIVAERAKRKGRRKGPKPTGGDGQ